MYNIYLAAMDSDFSPLRAVIVVGAGLATYLD